MLFYDSTASYAVQILPSASFHVSVSSPTPSKITFKTDFSSAKKDLKTFLCFLILKHFSSNTPFTKLFIITDRTDSLVFLTLVSVSLSSSTSLTGFSG